MPFFFSAERHSISKAVAYSCSSTLICSIERNIGVKEENWSPSVSFCLQTTKLFVIFLHFRIRRIGCDSWLTKTLIPFMHTGNIQRASNFFQAVYFFKGLHEDKLCPQCNTNTCLIWSYQELCFSTEQTDTWEHPVKNKTRQA